MFEVFNSQKKNITHNQQETKIKHFYLLDKFDPRSRKSLCLINHYV